MKRRRMARRIVIFVLFVAVFVGAVFGEIIYDRLTRDRPVNVELSVDEFAARIAETPPDMVTIGAQKVKAQYANGDIYWMTRGTDSDPLQDLQRFGLDPVDASTVRWNYKNSDQWSLLHIVALIALAVFFIAAISSTARKKTRTILKSKAKDAAQTLHPVRWDEVVGAPDAIEALQEISHFFRNPDLLEKYGARPRRGVLLTGPPGTGKTLMARALATDAEARFLTVAASSFVEIYVGTGAGRIRDLFDGIGDERTVVFIDEIDAVGRRRQARGSGGTAEYDNALNQLLVEIDGFAQRSNVLILGATNRADILDPALLRAGRFDRRIEIGLPDRATRFKILQVHLRNKLVSEGVKDSDIWWIADRTDGLSGADLEGLVNEAVTCAALADLGGVSRDDLTVATSRTLEERRGMSEPA